MVITVCSYMCVYVYISIFFLYVRVRVYVYARVQKYMFPGTDDAFDKAQLDKGPGVQMCCSCEEFSEMFF